MIPKFCIYILELHQQYYDDVAVQFTIIINMAFCLYEIICASDITSAIIYQF
jgi:hypothetical protein